MNSCSKLALVATTLMAGLSAPAYAQKASTAGITCIEVARFDLGDGETNSREEARVNAIPEHNIAQIQLLTGKYVARKLRNMRVELVGSGTCPDAATAAVLTGSFTDFKKGNKAMRYLLPGTGAQKFEVQTQLARKSDGSVIASDRVVDRKVGGFLGGSAKKGMDDFAEKVGDFVKDAFK